MKLYLKKNIPLIIFFLIQLVIFIFYIKYYQYASGDDATTNTFAHFSVKNHFNHLWQDILYGNQVRFYDAVPWLYIRYFLSIITNSETLSAIIHLYLFTFLLPSISIYYCLSKVSESNIYLKIIIVIYFVYHPFHQILYFSWIYSPLISFFPFIAGIFFANYERLEYICKKDLFLISLICSILLTLQAGAIVHLAYSNIYIFFFLFIILKILIDRNINKFINFIYILILTLSFFILINFIWLYPDLMLLKSFASKTLKYLSVVDFTHTSNFFNTLRGTNDWSYFQGFGPEYYHPYHKYYISNYFGITSSLLIVFFIIYGLKNLKTIRDLLPLYVILFLILIFVTGRNFPFGVVFSSFFDEFSIFKIFRSPTKTMIGYVFFSSIIFYLLLIQFFKKNEN